MTFANCSEAYNAGRSHIPSTDPDYASHLDRDKDGWACDNPPPGFKKKQQPEVGQPVTQPADQLPQTGPATELGIASGVLLTVGLLTAVLVRRRRVRFSA